MKTNCINCDQKLEIPEGINPRNVDCPVCKKKILGNKHVTTVINLLNNKNILLLAILVLLVLLLVNNFNKDPVISYEKEINLNKIHYETALTNCDLPKAIEKLKILASYENNKTESLAKIDLIKGLKESIIIENYTGAIIIIKLLKEDNQDFTKLNELESHLVSIKEPQNKLIKDWKAYESAFKQEDRKNANILAAMRTFTEGSFRLSEMNNNYNKIFILINIDKPEFQKDIINLAYCFEVKVVWDKATTAFNSRTEITLAEVGIKTRNQQGGFISIWDFYESCNDKLPNMLDAQKRYSNLERFEYGYFAGKLINRYFLGSRLK